VRACCDQAASQVVQLVDYAALGRRRNFVEEIAISESLKGMVKKLHQVVQQIVRQISEKQFTGSLLEDRTVLKHQHRCVWANN